MESLAVARLTAAAAALGGGSGDYFTDVLEP